MVLTWSSVNGKSAFKLLFKIYFTRIVIYVCFREVVYLDFFAEKDWFGRLVVAGRI